MRRGVRNTLFRASVVATSGFVAGAALEHKYPFYERLEGRLRNGRKWIDPYMNKSDSVAVPVIEDAKEEIRETVQAFEAPEAIESGPGVLAPQLEYLSDQLFETTDNMLVFMFPSEELYLKQKSRVSEISEKISKFIAKNPLSNLSKIRLMFSIVPPKNAVEIDPDTVEIMCYKGQRKLRTSLPGSVDIPVGDWEEFFRFKSTPVDEELKDCVIEHISGDEFEEKVVKASSVKKPVLVQVYEKSCFLCFLMRPFLNSVAELLNKDDAIPFVIKRLDIEENDFPEHMPVVRGTPTFIMFRGSEARPERLEEFKPRDFVKRICRDYLVSQETKNELLALVDRMTMRFQMFSGLVMWNTEADKILDLIAGDPSHNATIPFDAKNSEEKDKEMFNKLVAEYMSEDMLKVDALEDNLRALNRELTHMEKHAVMMGQVLGEKVLELEKNADRIDIESVEENSQ